LAFLIIASTAAAEDSYSTKTYPRSAARKLIVETDGGAITLQQALDGPSSVDVSPAAKPGDDCRVTQDLRNGVLRLTAHAAKNVFGMSKTCSAGFTLSGYFEEIQVRSGSGDVNFGIFCRKADIRTGSGSISLHNTAAALTLRSGSGKISGDASGPTTDASTGSGNVTLSGLIGAVAVKTGSGAVFLNWIAAPKRGAVDVRTGSGDLTALFPAAAKVKTSFRSGSGSLRSDFSDDDKAAVQLTFRSGSGGATVKKAP
jgi:hypothetical protein